MLKARLNQNKASFSSCLFRSQFLILIKFTWLTHTHTHTMQKYCPCHTLTFRVKISQTTIICLEPWKCSVISVTRRALYHTIDCLLFAHTTQKLFFSLSSSTLMIMLKDPSRENWATGSHVMHVMWPKILLWSFPRHYTTHHVFSLEEIVESINWNVKKPQKGEHSILYKIFLHVCWDHHNNDVTFFCSVI